MNPPPFYSLASPFFPKHPPHFSFSALKSRADNPSNRTQLHNPLHIRPLFPPPRILHPQRRPALLPHPLAALSPRPPCTPQPPNPRPRIRASNLRSRRNAATLPPTHLHTPQHPAAFRAQASSPPPRLRRHRFRRSILHLSPLTHHWPRGLNQKIGYWRSTAADDECEVVPYTASAEGEWEG